MQFPALLRGLQLLALPLSWGNVGLTCTLQSLLSRSSTTFSPTCHRTLTISVQIWRNYETIFWKVGRYVPPDSLPNWLRREYTSIKRPPAHQESSCKF